MTDINFGLLNRLRDKPHDLESFTLPKNRVPAIRTSHHLLDMVGITSGDHVTNQLDVRVYLAVMKINDLLDRLDRIQSWHSRETGPGGMVGDYCNECGLTWPCDTRIMADGKYVDDE